MSCKHLGPLLSRYLDDDLTPAERVTVETHLATCVDCAATVARWRQWGEEIDVMSGEADRELDRFEQHVYARLERNVGWILLSIGAALLLGFGAYYLIHDFLFDASAPLAVRLGVGFGTAGLVVLLVHTARQRLFARRSDRYKGVIR